MYRGKTNASSKDQTISLTRRSEVLTQVSSRRARRLCESRSRPPRRRARCAGCRSPRRARAPRRAPRARAPAVHPLLPVGRFGRAVDGPELIPRVCSKWTHRVEAALHVEERRQQLVVDAWRRDGLRERLLQPQRPEHCLRHGRYDARPACTHDSHRDVM